MDDRHARYRRTDADRRRRPVDGYRTSDAHRFRRLVRDAVSSLPRGLLSYLDGVEVAIEDVPPAPAGPHDQLALSRYHPDVPARRAPSAGAGGEGPPPGDRLTLYRRPLEARALDRLDLVQLIQDAVVQELVERFGLDDDRLDELGWG